MEGVGTVHIGILLHMDVHSIDKQTRMLSVGTTRDSVRMPESVILHAGREKRPYTTFSFLVVRVMMRKMAYRKAIMTPVGGHNSFILARLQL